MRDPLFWLPIKYKLPLTFGFICLTAFGVGGFVVATVAKRSLEKQIRLRLDEHSATTTLMVDRQLELLGRRVEDFASDGFIRTQMAELVDQDNTTTAKHEVRARLMSHLVANKLSLLDHFVDAFLLDPEGQLVLRVHGDWPERPASYHADALWFGPLEAPTKAHPYQTFLLSTPVLSLERDRRVGFLQILVRADTWVTRQLGRGTLPGNAPFRISLQDAEGLTLVLASPGEKGEARSLPQRAGEASSVIDYTTTIPRNGWKLSLEADKDQVMQPIDRLLKRFVITGSVLLLAVLALLVFPAQFLVRPLGVLRKSAQRIAEGDFSTTVNVDSRDEIGDLSRAFNIMANAIGERTSKLEETAAELESRQADIRRERDRLDMAINSMQDGLFILDRQGKISLSNSAAQPVASALTRKDAPRGRQPECATSDGKLLDCLQCLRDTDAPSHSCEIHLDSRVYKIHGTTLPAADGSAAERLFTTQDITERLVQAERQAHQERMAVLGQIAAVMAHELNNPLAAIAMFSQMLESDLEPGSPHRESAEVIRRNTETCKETIRMLLDTTASAAPEFSEFDMNELIQDIRRFLRPLCQRAEVDLDIECRAEGAILGDKLQLRQVVVNLLMNAIQAGEGRRIQVRVAMEERGESLAILVADTGPGIPPDAREHIFKPFFTTKPPGVGTGLGLPTSKRIVEAHGGSLRLIESKPERTVFEIVLPRRGRSQGRLRSENVLEMLSATVESVTEDEAPHG